MRKAPQIAFNNVAGLAKKHSPGLLRAFNQVLDSGFFLNGPFAKDVETKLRQLYKVKYAKVLGSGHDAVSFALQSLQLTSEEEVIIQANAYPTAFPVAMAGGKIKLAEVDDNGQMDLSHVERLITSKTKVVVVTHLYGFSGDIARLRKICEQHGILLIEDCAQAFGTTFSGKLLGTFGEVGCLSFYPSKNVGALGDGGAIVTNNKDIYDFVVQACQYGEVERYDSNFIAGHSRMPELQAAGVTVFWESWKSIKKQRQKVFQWYTQALSEASLSKKVRLYKPHKKDDSFFHLLVAEVPDKKAFERFCSEVGIPTMVHYPVPVRLVRAFAHLPFANVPTPHTEYLVSHRLSLPFHEGLTKKDVQYVVSHIAAFFNNRRQEAKSVSSLTIFFPFFNDAGTVYDAIGQAYEVGTELTNDLEVIAIHGGNSSDHTWLEIQRAKQQFPDLRVINKKQNKEGYAVIKHGFAAAKKEWVFYTDGDLQYDVRELKKLVETQLRTGADVINGYKVDRGDHWFRTLLAKAWSTFAQVRYHFPIRDIDCDFRLIKRVYIQDMKLEKKGAAVLEELITHLMKKHATFVELPVKHRERSYGESNYTVPMLVREKLANLLQL